MIQRVKAIYESGVLKPLDPVNLEEEEIVSLSIEKLADKEQLPDDDEYLPLIAEEGDPNVTWEAVRALLAKLPGSLTEDFDRERDERF